MRLIAKAILVGLTATAILAPSSSASADPIDHRTYLLAQMSGGGSFTSTDFLWTSGNKGLTDINLRISDQNCDSHPSYGYFEVYRPGPQTTETTVNRVDNSGCDSADYTSWSGLYIPDQGSPIGWVRVKICIDVNNNVQSGGTGGRSGDPCTYSPYAYAP